MFVGASGAGKSTMSRWLCRQYAQRGLPATLLSEQEVYQLDALQAFTEEWNRSDPAGIDTLLDAVSTLSGEWNASNTVWITDQFLPAFHWVLGKYPLESVEAYAEALAQILQPLHPLLVCLEADTLEGWRRAVGDRGETWSNWMVDLFKSRDFPQYPGGPIRDLDGLLRFLAWEKDRSEELLARWPGDKLILNTTDAAVERLEQALLRYVGLCS